MLKVYGHIYSDDRTKFAEIITPLTEAGFVIAYDSSNNATVIKEVVEENTDE